VLIAVTVVASLVRVSTLPPLISSNFRDLARSTAAAWSWFCWSSQADQTSIPSLSFGEPTMLAHLFVRASWLQMRSYPRRRRKPMLEFARETRKSFVD